MADNPSASSLIVPKAITLDDLLTKTFDEQPHIIKEGYLPEQGSLFIAGPPKSYKSFLLASIIYHLLTATNLFGAMRKVSGAYQAAFIVPKPQRILLLEQELGQSNLKERYTYFKDTAPSGMRDYIGDNFFIYSRDYRMRLDTNDGLNLIQQLINDIRPTVVCFDPLIEFHLQDENDARHMMSVMRSIDKLKQAYHFADIINHHMGKSDMATLRSGPDLMRGSSAIYGKGDAYITLTPVNREAGIIMLDSVVRLGKPINPYTIQIDFNSLRAQFREWGRWSPKKKATSENLSVN